MRAVPALPSEIWLEILPHITSGRDLAAIRATSRQLYAAERDPVVEAQRFRRYHGSYALVEYIVHRECTPRLDLRVVRCLLKGGRAGAPRPLKSPSGRVRGPRVDVDDAQRTFVDVDPCAVGGFAILGAVRRGDAAMVRLLLEDKRVRRDRAPLAMGFRIAVLRGYAEVVETLLRLDEEEEAQPVRESKVHGEGTRKPRLDPALDDNYAMRMASMHGHSAIMRLLLTIPRDPPLDAAFDEHFALRHAAMAGHWAIVDVLLMEDDLKRSDPVALWMEHQHRTGAGREEAGASVQWCYHPGMIAHGDMVRVTRKVLTKAREEGKHIDVTFVPARVLEELDSEVANSQEEDDDDVACLTSTLARL